MPAVRCSICQNEGLKAYVNAGLDRGISNAGIAAGISSAGGKLDPDVVGRHKKAHWSAPVDPDAPKPTKRDLAIMLQERVANAIEKSEPRKRLVKVGDEWEMVDVPFDILDKDLAPALAMGLKAQGLIDKREQTDKKLGLQAGYLGLQLLLRGLGEDEPAPVMIEDGLTIEGEFTEGGDA